jgi:hypothetical protein
MSHFLFTLVAAIAVACLAVFLVSPTPPGVTPWIEQLAGAGPGLDTWLGAAAATIGLVATRASAAELCIAPSNHAVCCYCYYGGSSVGWGFETEEGVPPCHLGWSGGFSLPCPYGKAVYSLSASSTDPLQNVSPLPPDHQLFLWLYADCLPGYSDDGYGYQGDLLTFQGDLQPTGYEPIVGRGPFS